MIRVGQGFDVHAFSDDPDRPLVLGGIEFPGEPGLAGHSDADVVAHAVSDAILGAAGLADIGQQFPDDSPAWEGADSISLLAKVVLLAGEHRWTVGNVDVTVICESPRLALCRQAMAARLTEVCQAPVSVKGKTAEGLGALGRGEGIAAMAVALVESM